MDSHNSWDLHNFFTSLGEVGHTVTIRRALGAGTERISPIKKQLNEEIWLETIHIDDANIEIKTKLVEPRYWVSPF